MKFFKGIKLLLTKPRTFVGRLREIMIISNARRRLQSLGSGRSSTVWVSYDDVEFPYHSHSTDEQELLYHAFFDEWFKATELLYAAHIKPGDTVIDVGANMGFTSLVLSRLVGASGTVHSFEPGGSMRARLQELVERNHLKQVVLHPVGCGERSEELTLSIPASSGNASLHLSSELANQVRSNEKVSIKPLDEVLGDQLNQLHFLKIDTEGFEIDVLRGAVRTIERLLPVICIELSREYQESSAATMDWLLARGYSFPIWPDLEQCHNGDNFIALPPLIK